MIFFIVYHRAQFKRKLEHPFLYGPSRLSILSNNCHLLFAIPSDLKIKIKSQISYQYLNRKRKVQMRWQQQRESTKVKLKILNKKKQIPFFQMSPKNFHKFSTDCVIF